MYYMFGRPDVVVARGHSVPVANIACMHAASSSKFKVHSAWTHRASAQYTHTSKDNHEYMYRQVTGAVRTKAHARYAYETMPPWHRIRVVRARSMTLLCVYNI